MDELADELVVRKVLAGESDCFRFLIQRYQQRIFSLGMRFFKNKEDAYDFIQEVFMKAYSKLATYQQKAPFRFWLAKLAYHHGLNQISSRKSTTELQDTVACYAPSPEQLQMQQEAKQILLAEIEKLPQSYQICLDFYFFMGLTYKQISEVTGFSINTIKSNVYRAKKILHDTLQGTIVPEYYDEM